MANRAKLFMKWVLLIQLEVLYLWPDGRIVKNWWNGWSAPLCFAGTGRVMATELAYVRQGVGRLNIFDIVCETSRGSIFCSLQ